jgi:hypothetical protein
VIEAGMEAVSLQKKLQPEKKRKNIAHLTLEGCNSQLNLRVEAPSEVKQTAHKRKKLNPSLIADPI